MEVSKMDLINDFIKKIPTLENNKELIEEFVKKININYNITDFNKELEISYQQFEDWLNQLFENEKVQSEIIAFNFGLFESKDKIQLYISGSTEWDLNDDDWACNNDYFPEGRYPNIDIYKKLNEICGEDLTLGLFLSLSTTILFANTYLLTNASKFPNNINLSTGFDDGDLYHFCLK
jgi:hypothetical protein